MVRALRCGCGRRLEAGDDEELFGEVAKHLRREHPATAVEDVQVRAFVTHAYKLEHAAPYAGGEGPDEGFGPEPY